jgi:glycosyltransferase 2 family protein
MVSRERLLGFGATIAQRATERRVRVLAQLLLAAALVFVVLRARSAWHSSHVDWSQVNWVALAGAVVLAAVATVSAALIWLAILKSLGVSTHLRSAGIFLQAQLGKYIPGSVWQYAGRAAVARSQGLPVRPVAVSLPIEFAASGVAAGAMGAFLLGWWGALVVGAAAIVLVVVERPARVRSVAVPATVRATFLYLPLWLVLGASFWLCAYGLVGVPAEDLAFYMGAFAIAWLAGLLAVYAPGGLGVREAVLVALLSGRIGAADALVVAAVHRLILVFVDVGLAGIATAAMRRGRPRLDVADTA